MTGQEHAAAIRAAIEAARDEGYLIEWDFDYIDWWGSTEVSSLTAGLYRLQRDERGVMMVAERAALLEADI